MMRVTLLSELFEPKTQKTEPTTSNKENLGLGDAFQSLAGDKIRVTCIAMYKDCIGGKHSYLPISASY